MSHNLHRFINNLKISFLCTRREVTWRNEDIVSRIISLGTNEAGDRIPWRQDFLCPPIMAPGPSQPPAQ
jgi:hypothetical protein